MTASIRTHLPVPKTSHSNMRSRVAKLLEWLFLSAFPVLLLLYAKPQLMAVWRWIISSWAGVLGLSLSTPLAVGDSSVSWHLIQDGSLAPSTTQIMLTATATGLVWLLSTLLSDRLHPLKIVLRVLCLIQWSACLFFSLAPASFPYTIGKHLNAVMSMGYGLMLAMGPMLALGWGILNVPWVQKIMAPLLFMSFFTLMLPHKALLHVWLLEHFSILFMPVLFLCFGTLLDLWIFIALYAFLASLAPAQIQPRRAVGEW